MLEQAQHVHVIDAFLAASMIICGTHLPRVAESDMALLQLVAQRRVLRAEDKDTYPSLCTASRLLNNPGSAERPLYVQPLEVLQYLSTELFTSNFSSKTVGPFGLEGIVRIVAQLVHAATAVVQGKQCYKVVIARWLHNQRTVNGACCVLPRNA